MSFSCLNPLHVITHALVPNFIAAELVKAGCCNILKKFTKDQARSLYGKKNSGHIKGRYYCNFNTKICILAQW